MNRLTMTAAAIALIPWSAFAEGMAKDNSMTTAPMPNLEADVAQQSAPVAPTLMPEEQTMVSVLGVTGDVSANSVIGAPVYVIDGEFEVSAMELSLEAEWERAGSVEDIVIGADGQIAGFVAEVGGFLGIGDKLVMLEVSEVRLIPQDGGGFDVVTPYSDDELTDMDAYETAMLQ